MVDPQMTPYYYHLVDFFVSFSQSETQGLTYIEALASNTPVIAREDTHLIPLIVPQKSGYLFKTKEEFLVIIKTIHDQPKHLTSCQPQALDYLQSFSAKTYAHKVETVYLSLLQPLAPASEVLPVSEENSYKS